MPIFVLFGLLIGFESFTAQAKSATLFANYPFLPWLAFLAALGVLIWTVDRWARILPVAAFACVIPYLGTLLSEHVYMNPTVRISRAESVQGIFFALAAGVISLAIQKQPLNAVRRVTAVLFANTFLFAVFVGTRHSLVQFRAEILAVGILVAGWIVNHFLTRGTELKAHTVRRGGLV